MANIDFNKIKEAVRQRDDFLEEHPELQPLQDEINEVLKKAGKNHHNRQVALQTMMLNSWFRIVEVWERKGSK